MAQLRQEYPLCQEKGVEIVVVGPDSKEEFQRYWQKEQLPFIGLPDPEQKVLRLYGQPINWLKLGRMPAQFLIDKEGILRYVHYGRSMSDIPDTGEILASLTR